MASSSSPESSYLNSTSGLLSLLDLNLQEDQNMEEMDIDQVVDVPDTPDRLAARLTFGKECVGIESDLSLDGSLRNPDFVDGKCMNGLRGRDRNRRLVIRSRENLSNDEHKGTKNPLILSPSKNVYASRNAHLFRRPEKDEGYNHKTRHSIRTEDIDKGKSICSKFPSKSSGYHEDTAFLDLTEQKGDTQNAKTVFLDGSFEDPVAGDKMKDKMLPVGGSSSNCIQDSHNASRNVYKGKEKFVDNAFNHPSFTFAPGKGANRFTDFQCETEKQMPMPGLSLILPRVSGQKRLVRNGCISPHNIATRAKQLAEREIASSTVEQSHSRFSESPPCPIDIGDIVSRDNSGDRVKGKRIIIHHSTPKEEQGANTISTTSSPGTIDVGTDGSSYAGGAPFGCSEGLGGWRSTRNRSRKADHPVSERAGGISGRIDGFGDSGSQQKNTNIVSEADCIVESHHAANTINRRQKKHRMTSRNAVECSTSVSNDSDIVFLGSSGESFNSRSFRNRTHERRGNMRPVIEVEELPSEVRQTISHDLGCINNDYSDARARQVEADEMLARELQEQLYQEVPVVGGGEIDENLAWGLQQDVFHNAPGARHNESHPRGSLVSRSNRQPWSRSSHNPSTRRGTQVRAPISSRIAPLMGTQARIPTSSRIARLRNRFSMHPPTVSSTGRNVQFPSDLDIDRVDTGRNVQFPLDMDLDMRLDILEALEAAVGDLSDMSVANHIFQMQRDFNQNDYEMLLALDDSNHQHGGASVNQINCLPQSTVRTDTGEEACAICLEIPTVGETIRHLPCLHKFHKDCIDPWLSRKTSCPVCKSSIT